MGEKPSTNYFIYFAAFAIHIIIFSVGTSWSWTSPFLPKFESNDPSVNPISRPITITEAGLMVSIINLGLLIGPVFPSIMIGKFGKKRTILITATPLLLAHIICCFAKTVEVFLVARFMMGLSSGAVWSAIPVYLGEICEPKNRGQLGGFLSVMSSSGSLFGYCTGPFLSMKWFSIANMIPVMLFIISVFFFIPESPYDFILKKELDKAEKSLIKLRKRTDVQAELVEIKKSIEATSEVSEKFINIFKNADNLKVIMLGIGIMLLNGWSGLCAVLGYTQKIFDLSGSSMPPEYSAMLVGSVALFSTIIHIKLVDKLGRRVLLTTSCSLVFLSLSTLGLFFYLKQNKFNVESLDWVPVCSLVLYMFGYYFALASVPYIMLGEIFSPHIKTIASSFCMTINFILNFFLTLGFPYFFESISIAGTFWLFAVLNSFGIIFCLIFLPETKGKTLQEINEMLNKRNSKH